MCFCGLRVCSSSFPKGTQLRGAKLHAVSNCGAPSDTGCDFADLHANRPLEDPAVLRKEGRAGPRYQTIDNSQWTIDHCQSKDAIHNSARAILGLNCFCSRWMTTVACSATTCRDNSAKDLALLEHGRGHITGNPSAAENQL